MIRILIFLLIAAVCGSVGARIAGASKKGCLASIALGFIGALIGGWLSRQLHMREILAVEGIPVIWAIIGSALFVAFINLISGGGSKKD